MKSLYLKLTGTLMLVGIIVACGGGGGGIAGIGGSGYIATGSVTGFGSVWVNGIRFNTDAASFEVEDNINASQDDLKIGMVVQVEGSINADGTSGTATRIRYGDQLKGPVEPIQGESAIINPDGTERKFSVLGTNVIVHTDNTVFVGGTSFNFDSLALDNFIEISGYYDQNNQLRATYVELKAADFDAYTHTVEIEGLIANLDANFDFDLRNINVITGNNTSYSDLPNSLQNGLYVEVKGLYNALAGTINATEVEGETIEIKSDGSDVSIEGYITRYVDNSDFDVNGLRVNASGIGVSFEPTALATQLRVGIQVEVEGYVVNNILIADEVEAEGGDAEVHATISGPPNTTAGTFNLEVTGQTITIQTTSSTTFEDESTGTIVLANLADTDFIEVSGFESDINNHTIIASEIKRRNSPSSIILQGYATLTTGSATVGGTITILEVAFPFDISVNSGGTTRFDDLIDENMDDLEINDLLNSISSTTPVLLKIKDSDGDNLADEIDLED